MEAGYLIIGYIFGLVVTAGIALLVYDDGHGDDQLAARLGLLSPLWPVVAVYGLYKLVASMWEMSGWTLEKEKK